MDWVRVRNTEGMPQAEILQKMLESFGIPVRLEFESYGRVMGMTVDGLGAVGILVPSDRAAEARELLKPLTSGGG
jgi:hypothetical protein